MRGLEVSDIFAAARIIKELDLKEKIKEIALDTSASNMRVAGFDIVWTIIENATEKKAELRVYEFVAKLLEIEPAEVAKMNPTKLLSDLLEVANIEEWKSFFKSVRLLIQRS